MGKVGKNEKKLRELTSDVFRQVKIYFLHSQLFISTTGPDLYGRGSIPLDRLPGHQQSKTAVCVNSQMNCLEN